MSASAHAEAQLQHWLRHRGALTELVQQLPESAARFRPWPEAMTTPHLIQHIALSSERMLRAVREGAPAGPPAVRPVPPETIAQAREILRERTASSRQLLESITEAQLEARVAFGPMGELPGWVLVTLAIDHEIHHKGQLWTYARMCGVAPPPFVQRG